MAMADVNCTALLGPLERGAVATVLEEFTDALSIYRYYLQKYSWTVPDVHFNDLTLRGSKSCGCRDIGMMNRDAIATMKDFEGQVVEEKLDRDSDRVGLVSLELKERVRRYGQFDVLIRENEAIELRQDIERNVIRKAEEIEKAVDGLRRALTEQKTENDREAESLKRKLLDTQKRLGALRVMADVEYRYVTSWERARCEQNSLCWEIDLNRLTSTLKNRAIRGGNENRVNAELLAFLARDTASIEEEIGVLQERYRKERVAYEEDLRALREQMETRRSVLKELTGEYRSNQAFIDACLAEKEALRIRKEQEEHMIKSATKIEAWWRGVMVRRKLGPYKPDDKKKKRAVKGKKSFPREQTKQ